MTKSNKVYLVGAGPGDVGLLTLKGRDVIEKAGCIIYDHLVNDEILGFANETAELIYAGKQGHKCGITQEEINDLIIKKAAKHPLVVRLKGGDPFVFGRGGEEAIALKEAGIDYEIVPGISSGIAAASYAGIPVTHRGLSSSVAFVTGHESPDKSVSSVNWQQLATAVETLVIFMGTAKISDIAQKLMENGRSQNTPLALISKGTRDEQTVKITTLGEVSEWINHQKIQLPAIIIVGEVVSLNQQLQWFAPSAWQSAFSDEGELMYV